MSSQVYEETGNKIPVTEAELLIFMNTKYTDYYNDNKLPNPDKTDVIYTTKDGKTIKVPDEIKMKAKTEWLKSLMEESKQNIKKIKNNRKETEDQSKWGNTIIFIVVIIVALYLLYMLSQRS